MEDKNQVQVGFIQVESVKALVEKCSSSYIVPQQYVRPEMETNQLITSSQVPIIDLARLRDPLYSEKEIAKLGSACGEWGFFQLINHGVNDELINNMKRDVTEFFALPLEEKKTLAIAPKDLEGFGQHFVLSNDQKLDWADILFLNTQPVERRNLKVWPTNPPTFRDTMDKYSCEMKKLWACLIEFMARDLKIEHETLLQAFKGHPQATRMNCYPPCPQAEKVLGLSAHSDTVGLTLLLQVNDVQSLQIRKDGKWFSVQVLPKAFVVNVGDVLEILTNGRYTSVEHRAIINTTKERISIATFCKPFISSMVGPLPEVAKEGKMKYKTVTCLEFRKFAYSEKLNGRRRVDCLRLNN